VHDGGARPAGELNLRGDGAALEILIALQVEQRVLAMHSVEFLRNDVHDDVVPVLAAEAMVAVGGDHPQVAVFDPHDRDVKGAAAEVEHKYGLVGVEFLDAIGERRGGGLIEDLQNIESGELSGGE